MKNIIILFIFVIGLIWCIYSITVHSGNKSKTFQNIPVKQKTYINQTKINILKGR